MNKLILGVHKMLKKEPDVKYFGLLLYAGHGMIRDGVQCFLINQFSKQDEFYVLNSVETNIRDISKWNKNAYLVAIFACCREIFIKTRHCKCIGATSVVEAKGII